LTPQTKGSDFEKLVASWAKVRFKAEEVRVNDQVKGTKARQPYRVAYEPQVDVTGLSLAFDPASTSLVEVGTPASLTAILTDSDGNPAEGIPIVFTSSPTGLVIDPAKDKTDAEGKASVTASSTSPAIYTVTASSVCGRIQDTWMIVVYDPSGGFVTGGGWIDSPAGALVADPTAEGKASFGFVAKYNKKTKMPEGNTEFVFKAGDINFHSNDYDWLVVNQGGSNAQFKGTGTINGLGEYKFMIWAKDGEPDAFRIKIWEENAGTETIVYDNGFAQALGGGSIVVHTR